MFTIYVNTVALAVLNSSINMKESKLTYQIQNLNFEYGGKTPYQALKNINLNIERGEFLAFSGPSGSGKSTLLHLLGLIEPINGSGDIAYNNLSLKTIAEVEKNRIRRYEMGFIFQNFHLINVLNSFENIEYFMIRQKVATDVRTSMVKQLLAKVGLSEQSLKKPLEMSGGQKQRVAIARALAKRPKVIIADEPTASLDQKTGREIIELLKKLSVEEKITVILASHDPMVLEHSSRIIKLRDGSIFP